MKSPAGFTLPDFVDCQPARTLSQQNAGFPTHPLRGTAEFFEGAILDLSNPFFANAKKVANLAKAMGAIAGEAKAKVEYLSFARAKVFHKEKQGFLTLVAVALFVGLVVRHRFG